MCSSLTQPSPPIHREKVFDSGPAYNNAGSPASTPLAAQMAIDDEAGGTTGGAATGAPPVATAAARTTAAASLTGGFRRSSRAQPSVGPTIGAFYRIHELGGNLYRAESVVVHASCVGMSVVVSQGGGQSQVEQGGRRGSGAGLAPRSRHTCLIGAPHPLHHSCLRPSPWWPASGPLL